MWAREFLGRVRWIGGGSVAEELVVDDALDAVGQVPAAPIPLRVEAVAVSPPFNALVLAVVVNRVLKFG